MKLQPHTPTENSVIFGSAYYEDVRNVMEIGSLEVK